MKTVMVNIRGTKYHVRDIAYLDDMPGTNSNQYDLLKGMASKTAKDWAMAEEAVVSFEVVFTDDTPDMGFSHRAWIPEDIRSEFAALRLQAMGLHKSRWPWGKWYRLRERAKALAARPEITGLFRLLEDAVAAEYEDCHEQFRACRDELKRREGRKASPKGSKTNTA